MMMLRSRRAFLTATTLVVLGGPLLNSHVRAKDPVSFGKVERLRPKLSRIGPVEVDNLEHQAKTS